MSPNDQNERDDELAREYRFDYRKAKPNRFAQQDGSRAVILAPDVAAVFQDAEAVNAVLRALIATMPRVTQENSPEKPHR